jgi:hypothetical protein
VVKGNAIVPSYVLEYLLGQYCATADEASIQSGIETVRGFWHALRASQRGWPGALDIRERGPPQGDRQDERRSQRKARCLRGDLQQSGHQAGAGRSRHDQAPSQAAGQWRLVHRRSGIRVLGGQERRPWILDGQADPALQLRSGGLHGGAPRLHHRRMDRSAAPEHRLQPGVLRPAQPS